MPEQIAGFNGDLVLTTNAETTKSNKIPILCEDILELDPTVIRGLIMQKLGYAFPSSELLIGIDPGKRIGLSIFYYGKEIERSFYTSIDDLVFHLVRIFVELHPKKRIVRIGNGDMNLAKKIVGVKRVVLANPRSNGKLNPAILYVAKKIGIKEIYSMGGAQAIASLAYIQKVNKIVGPGNIYVAKAKKEVFGDVGIEGMIAGPSEITVVADSKSDINQVVTSIIAQAEHDVNSQSILITKHKKLINNFKKNITNNLKNLPRKKIAEKSLKDNGLIIYARSDKQIIDAINEIAPEHLELNIVDSKKYLNKIYNSGSICIGKYSPMAVTDYNAGTNHVLPTLGSAKFSSGLNLNEFYKKISHIKLSKKGVEKIGKYATHLAEYEELEGHAQSIKSRIRRK